MHKRWPLAKHAKKTFKGTTRQKDENKVKQYKHNVSMAMQTIWKRITRPCVHLFSSAMHGAITRKREIGWESKGTHFSGERKRHQKRKTPFYLIVQAH